VTATRTEPCVSVESDARRKILKLKRSICSTVEQQGFSLVAERQPRLIAQKKSLNPSSSRPINLRIRVVAGQPEDLRGIPEALVPACRTETRAVSQDALEHLRSSCAA